MTILVTGGAGYIGSHMALRLIEAQEQVVILDNLSTGSRKLVPKNCIFIEGDVGDIALVTKLLKDHNISEVIHFAASIIVPDSVKNPLKYYENNTLNMQRLLVACTKAKLKHFIFSSTAAVYGNPKTIPVSELEPLNPLSPYGASKMMAERILQDTATAAQFSYAILRYFNVAGADPERRSGQVVKEATHLIKVGCETALGKRPSMQIFGTKYPTPDGTCIRDYIHVSDLVEAHYLALNALRQGQKSDIYNCGYGLGFSVREVIKTIQEVSETPFHVLEASAREGDPAQIVADVTKLRQKLCFSPRFHDLKTIIQHALSWEKSQSQ